MNANMYTRRRFLALMAGTAVSAAGGLALAAPKVINPCRAALPPELAASPWLSQVWDGLDPELVWDCHVHLAGTGDGGSGIVIGRQLAGLTHPLQYAQRLFYMNAGCTNSEPGQVDRSYVARLLNLTAAMPEGCKALLFAFDRYYDEAGRADDRPRAARDTTVPAPDVHELRMVFRRHLRHRNGSDPAVRREGARSGGDGVEFLFRAAEHAEVRRI